MSRRLPSLNALRAFEAAARHLSFVRAAEELHVTPAAVSQQIKLLEDHLGTTLFQRGRKLALSEAASDALPLISEAFDRLERAVMKVKADGPEGTLVVSAPPAFAARWIIPRLEDFNARHPAIELRLLATRRLVDFSVEDVDAAIRFGAGNDPGLQVERLMRETIVPVAAPALATSITTSETLAGAALIEDEWHTSNGAFPDWATWLASLGVGIEAPLRIRRFGDANLVIQAAVAGMGVALSWYSLVAEDLKAGRLVRVLDNAIPSELGYRLVMPHNRSDLARVRAFRAWLLEQSSTQAPA
jgi:LysR family glycine cleavage system transcriptional activator